MSLAGPEMKWRRLLAVLARERGDDHLKQIEEGVAESIARVHVHRNGSKPVLVDVKYGYVFCVLLVDSNGALREEKCQHCHKSRTRVATIHPEPFTEVQSQDCKSFATDCKEILSSRISMRALRMAQIIAFRIIAGRSSPWVWGLFLQKSLHTQVSSYLAMHIQLRGAGAE